MQIHSSCSDMTEEDLAKLSIRLLNCQLEISGKNQVLCSEEMVMPFDVFYFTFIKQLLYFYQFNPASPRNHVSLA